MVERILLIQAIALPQKNIVGFMLAIVLVNSLRTAFLFHFLFFVTDQPVMRKRK